MDTLCNGQPLRQDHYHASPSGSSWEEGLAVFHCILHSAATQLLLETCHCLYI